MRDSQIQYVLLPTVKTKLKKGRRQTRIFLKLETKWQSQRMIVITQVYFLFCNAIKVQTQR